MWTRSRCALVVAASLGGLAVAGVTQASGPRLFAFETDKWFSLDDTKQGPVTWHRIQVARQKGLLTKSSLFRPGNAEYLASIELRLEFSNAATRDYNGRLRIAILDDAGREIDGYNGTEELESEQKYQVVTIKLSTLKYGLERAKQLRVSLEADPD